MTITIIAACMGYLILGVLTNFWLRNLNLNRLFRAELRELNPDNWDRYNTAAENEADRQNRALRVAKSANETMVEFVGPLLSSFLPVGLMVAIGWTLYNQVANLLKFDYDVVMPSWAERSVRKASKKAQHVSDELKALDAIIRDPQTDATTVKILKDMRKSLKDK